MAEQITDMSNFSRLPTNRSEKYDQVRDSRTSGNDDIWS